MDKKTELLTNAATIIYQEGLQKLTMDYLAQKSNMTKGGVLYHFSSKSTLLLRMNERVIEQYEAKMKHYQSQLSGSYIYVRAYALATLDYLREPAKILFPAVLITSLEDTQSRDLWDRTSKTWEKAMSQDQGDPMKILQLQLICDGIWFSIMYNDMKQNKEQMEQLVLDYCQSLTMEE